MLKNKKAWVAVIEAVLAIVILFTFLLLSFQARAKQQSKTDINFNSIFSREIEENQTFRTLILNKESDKVKNYLAIFLEKFVNNREIGTCISESYDSCSVDLPKKDVIVSDFFVTSNSNIYSPKKLKIFIWENKR